MNDEFETQYRPERGVWVLTRVNRAARDADAGADELADTRPGVLPFVLPSQPRRAAQ
ncbi:MAG: hypothetical protein AAGA54_32565 [Myxococcota bacterium]